MPAALWKGLEHVGTCWNSMSLWPYLMCFMLVQELGRLELYETTRCLCINSLQTPSPISSWYWSSKGPNCRPLPSVACSGAHSEDHNGVVCYITVSVYVQWNSNVAAWLRWPVSMGPFGISLAPWADGIWPQMRIALRKSKGSPCQISTATLWSISDVHVWCSWAGPK